ncbi:hypothetical protein SKAU_G00244790 [Synaphobranchus kaupii]|uniref:Uncharacterized protein n=1 Tax=Synaphobranchus kaupii TaxID=118154 RepID=A0A9Q1F1N1_SYNKA|nr:hypothetical protein SKAU_G00244790 [Synaphobranchus kaupii]
MTRLTLRSTIGDAMRGVDHIATTTDCWSVRRRSFVGITAHWIDPDSLKRCSAALACKQLRGSHTFDVLEIQGKIVRTTTDNGSNFIKTFQVFGEDENNNVVGSNGDASQPGEDEEDQEVGEEVEFVDVSVLLNEDDGFEFQLPKHQRCASAAPNCYQVELLFLAVERLLRIIKDKGEGAIRVICTDLKVPMFNPAELAFLSEYAAAMSPVTQAHFASRSKCPDGVATSDNQPADRQI